MKYIKTPRIKVTGKASSKRIPHIISRYGGKFCFCQLYEPIIRKLLANGNGTEVMVDLFGGAATFSILGATLEQNYQPLLKKIICNDVDKGIINLFKVLQDENMANRLVEKLLQTEYDREEFKFAHSIMEVLRSPDILALSDMGALEGLTLEEADALYQTNIFRDHLQSTLSPLEKAYYQYIECEMSYSAIGKTFAPSGTTESFHNKALSLMNKREAISRIVFENSSYEKVIDKYRNEKCLWIADPPYLSQTRVCDDVYHFEASGLMEHYVLINRLLSLNGSFMLCGYDTKACDGYAQIVYKRLDQKDVLAIDLGIVHRPSTRRAIRPTDPHEMVWVRGL